MDFVSIRYNIQHVGDIFCDILQKPVDLGKQFAKGVAITYDIRDLKCRRQDILREMGQRMVEVTAQGGSTTDDEKLAALAVGLRETDEALDAKVKEREEKLKATSCCTGQEGTTQGG